MNVRTRYAAYLLLGASIVLTLFAFPVNRSKAEVRTIRPTADFRARTTETVEEKATLSPAKLITSGHLWLWAENHSYCGPPGYKTKLSYPDNIPGTIVAGFKHYYDKGAIAFGCPDGSSEVFRGYVWFDLSDIMKKAPPLHVAVTSASLHFKPSFGCPGEVAVATADWMKDYPADGRIQSDPLFPGDPFASITSCGVEDCSIDVKTVLNNWLKGAEHGGYANYGFVFKGMTEGDVRYDDEAGCYSRYGDFSLTVDYKYDREPILMVVLPKPPTPGRTNYALAANGGKALSSSTLAPNVESYVNDGDRTGAGGKVWLDDTLGTFPDFIEIDLDGKKAIDEIDVITRQDDLKTPGEPSLSQVFTLYGITSYDVQYWDGSGWIIMAPVTDNDKVWRKFTPVFPVVTDKIRIQINSSKDNAFSRVVEVEAWGK